MNSKFLTLNLKDFGHGLLVAVGGAVLNIVLPAVQAGQFSFDWKQIGATAISAGLAFVGVKLFTNSTGTLGVHPNDIVPDPKKP